MGKTKKSLTSLQKAKSRVVTAQDREEFKQKLLSSIRNLERECERIYYMAYDTITDMNTHDELKNIDLGLDQLPNDVSVTYSKSLDRFIKTISKRENIRLSYTQLHALFAHNMKQGFKKPSAREIKLCTQRPTYKPMHPTVNKLFKAITKSLRTHTKSKCNKNLIIRSVIKDIAKPCADAYNKDVICTQLVFAMGMLKLMPVVVSLKPEYVYENEELWCLESIKESIGEKDNKLRKAKQDDI